MEQRVYTGCLYGCDTDAAFCNCSTVTVGSFYDAHLKKRFKKSEEKRKEIKAADSTYKELESNNNKSKAAFKSKKDDCKEGENRIHPNICAYDHLDDIDFGAKSYDIFLNSIIPTIRLLIDDRIGDNC